MTTTITRLADAAIRRIGKNRPVEAEQRAHQVKDAERCFPFGIGLDSSLNPVTHAIRAAHSNAKPDSPCTAPVWFWRRQLTKAVDRQLLDWAYGGTPNSGNLLLDGLRLRVGWLPCHLIAYANLDNGKVWTTLPALRDSVLPWWFVKPKRTKKERIENEWIDEIERVAHVETARILEAAGVVKPPYRCL